jgi:four helix bundle protein
MKYERFEQLPVWQAAIELGRRVFRLVDDRSFGGQGDLRDQLQRAAVSISNNIAEGFERGTTQELLTFLYYARGSAGEVRSMLLLCERLPYFDHLKSDISDLKSLAESIARQVRRVAAARCVLQREKRGGQRSGRLRPFRQRQVAGGLKAGLIREIR